MVGMTTVGYTVPTVAVGTGVAILTGILKSIPAKISLAFSSLFSFTIASTVLKYRVAMASSISPGMTLYSMMVPGGTKVETGVAVGNCILGGGTRIFCPT